MKLLGKNPLAANSRVFCLYVSALQLSVALIVSIQVEQVTTGDSPVQPKENE